MYAKRKKENGKNGKCAQKGKVLLKYTTKSKSLQGGMHAGSRRDTWDWKKNAGVV